MSKVKNQVSSSMRNILNSFRRKLVKNPRTKKKLSILYHNVQALFDFRKPYNKLFDYNKLMQGKQRFFCRELYYGNSLYGHEQLLKEYAGFHEKINACIEHGVYFGDIVLEGEADNSGLNGLITFSDKRVEHLKKVATVPVVPIGPYIHYAEPLIKRDDIEKIKQENGKTLLVFPTHSIDRVETDFDFESFNDEIQRVVKEHDIKHVMICLFYKDVSIGRDKFYVDQGYQVVCNGYVNDPMFLRRLKTFILLSDFTMSNDVGTNVGYCAYLGKPHYVYSQDLVFKPYTQNDMENCVESELAEIEKNEVKNVFGKAVEQITEDQIEVATKYWGFNHVKGTDEMLMILKSFK